MIKSEQKEKKVRDFHGVSTKKQELSIFIDISCRDQTAEHNLTFFLSTIAYN